MTAKKTKPKPKKKVGRPSTYDPSYCDLVRKLGATGGMAASFAAALGVNKDTIYQWGKDHAEFSDALKDAKSSGEAFYLKQAENRARNGSDVMIKFLLSAAYGYREKTDNQQEVTIKGSAADIIKQVHSAAGNAADRTDP